MRTKKAKPLTVRQQIQQCPTLTPEERSLALFGLNKAKMIQPMYKEWALYRKTRPNRLLDMFYFPDVSVIKGSDRNTTCYFWHSINKKLQEWQQQ